MLNELVNCIVISRDSQSGRDVLNSSLKMFLFEREKQYVLRINCFFNLNGEKSKPVFSTNVRESKV